METKKFFCSALISLLCFLLSSCESMGVKTRADRDLEKDPVEVSQVDPEATVNKPEFLKKQAPRLGIILGGGGALSFAHIGFLQELESQKVPIHSVAGVEWGALVAGAYAVENKAHAVEWKLLKIPHSQFTSRSLFSSGKSVAVSEFNDFLAEVFKGRKFSDLEIPFVCSYVNVSKERSIVQNRGSMRNAVRNCWPLTPHFNVEVVAANLESVEDLAKYLKRNGAEVVVYVDVIAKNKLFKKSERSKKPLASVLWTQNKNIGKRLNPSLVDEWVQIPLPNHQMTSYKSLRSIVRMGQLKAKEKVKTLARKYAY